MWNHSELYQVLVDLLGVSSRGVTGLQVHPLYKHDPLEKVQEIGGGSLGVGFISVALIQLDTYAAFVHLATAAFQRVSVSLHVVLFFFFSPRVPRC